MPSSISSQDANTKGKSGPTESIKEGVAEVAVEVGINMAFDAIANAFNSAADVATTAGGMIVDCGAAVVDAGCEVGGMVIEGIADQL